MPFVITVLNLFSLVRELKLEMMSELPPSPDVVITAEDVEGFEPCGKYKPYQEKFSSGRRVFKHESEEYFLYGNFTNVKFKTKYFRLRLYYEVSTLKRPKKFEELSL